MSVIAIDVILHEVEPHVTRTLLVLNSLKLDRFHLALQAAFGWKDCHLYMFESGDKRWSVPDPEWPSDDIPIDKASVADLISSASGGSIIYVYDFGDNWRHSLRIGEPSEAVPGELYPRLVEVSGRCPPEDVGGSPGYEHFLEAMGDPSHPDHDELTGWYGGTFDPHVPKADKLRLEVLKLAERWKT